MANYLRTCVYSRYALYKTPATIGFCCLAWRCGQRPFSPMDMIRRPCNGAWGSTNRDLKGFANWRLDHMEANNQKSWFFGC